MSKQVFRATLIVLLTLLGAYVLLLSVHVIMVLLVAIIIASAVRPVVKGLQRYGIPEGAAIVLVYVAMAAVVIGLIAAVLPPIINQFAQYIEDNELLTERMIEAQRWTEETIKDVTGEDLALATPEEVESAVADFTASVRESSPTFLDDVGATLGEAILIFVMGAYWLTSREKTIAFVMQLSPPRFREKVEAVIDEIERNLGSYMRGVVIVASIVGILNFITLFVLGVPNALLIALTIAVTTTIPMIGGFLGGVIALFITLVSAPQFIPTVLVTFFVIQQIENYILSPRILSGQVGMDPLLVIVYTAIGFVMFGIIGALIAVPLMSAIHILVRFLVLEPHRKNIRIFQTEDGLPVVRQAETKEESRPQQPVVEPKPNET